MKKKFSNKWTGSKQVRKKRKYVANAPLHIRRKFVSANLSKVLRDKYTRRSFPLRKDDVVKVMRGEFKGKKGKISIVNVMKSKVVIEGIQRTKKDGTKVNVPFAPSNLQIQELNLDDKKRIVAIERRIKPVEKKVEVKEIKEKK